MILPILEVENLSIKIAGLNQFVVQEVSFKLNPGQCLGLVGESGSGKTLTALSVMQLLPEQALVSKASRILFSGQDLLTFSERRMRTVRGRRISMIFQDAMSAFNPVLTIGQQLFEILIKSFPRQQLRRRAIALLTEVGMDNPDRCLGSYPFELSGGMRQRAMIAMALCGNPELLIADEPTTALDVTLQAQILMLLRELSQKRQLSILFISHDLRIVSKLADFIVVLQKGQKVEENSHDNFFQRANHPYSQQLLHAILPTTARKKASSNAACLLTVKDLKIYFPNVKAVDGVSFQINAGETFALVGESGSGKTTAAKGIERLLPLTGGEIVLNGKLLSSMRGKSLLTARKDLQIIFQDPYSALNPRMLIADCLVEGLRAQNIKLNRKQYIAEAEKLLSLVELPKSAKWRYPHEFSGGERQRLCLARALAVAPKLLILDEPTSALDVSIQKQVLALLDKLQQELGIAYLLITHDLGVVAYLADRMAVMKQGKIVESGPTEQLLSNPQNEYTKKLLT